KNPEGRFVRFKKQDTGGRARENREIVRLLPNDLGRGRFTSLTCRPGMNICLSQCRFDRDYQANVAWPSPMVTFVFGLSGMTSTRNSCHGSPMVMGAGDAYVHYFEDPTLNRNTEGGKELNGLAIRISPEILAPLMNPEEDSKTGKLLGRALKKGYLFSAGKMSPSMTMVLFQMFNCPHRGIIKKIYLESKAMELVAYQLEQVFEREGPKEFSYPVNAEEKQRICRARDLLVDQLQFPPSLPDLARQVGMSHSRLTRGFKRVFNCTVFEYLRQERLKYARRLLTENTMNITQVAFNAGFCSSSHFAVAFAKRFGVRPSAYRNAEMFRTIS
ncbi:MAG: AraC family transcriptional regulator, partial [Desulfobacterium sp.]